MKTTIICVISLDGYLNPKLEMSPEWSSRQDRQLFVDETKRTGVMIMGQNTFKYSFHDRAMPDRYSVVITHDTGQQAENVWFTDDSPQAILKAIEEKGYKEASIVGGSMINSLFLDAGLVDELLITISPHLFGSGVPLLAPLKNDIQLELLESKPLGPGELLNRYKVLL